MVTLELSLVQRLWAAAAKGRRNLESRGLRNAVLTALVGGMMAAGQEGHQATRSVVQQVAWRQFLLGMQQETPLWDCLR